MNETQGPADSQIKCTSCGYDLTGVTIGTTCPECGLPVSAAYQATMTGKTSGQAITSMVLGIVSLVFGIMAIPTMLMCCPCSGFVSLICGPLAIYFWYISKTPIAEGKFAPASRGMALTGLICGILGAIIGLIFALMMLAGIIVAIIDSM